MSESAKDKCPAEKLSPAITEKKLAEIPGWQIQGNKLLREYKFKDFLSALAFVNKVGELAEAANHHPDIFLAWGKVKIELWTHSAGGLTEADFKLASKI